MFIKMSLIYKLNRKPIKDAKKIPIIINNRNRVTSLKQLISSLEMRGYRNIYIIDNASTYPPLLEYYLTCPYKVFYLKQNVGCFAIWETDIYKQFINDYYVYTDSDVVPVEECPDDFLGFLWTELKRSKDVYKIGLSLKIDDLPDCYKHKQKVIEWESQFFNRPVSRFFFEANIDTTFALYKPGLKVGTNYYVKMLRSAAPYELRHLPWYIDSDNLPEEELFYVKNANTVTHWTQQTILG